MTPHPRDSADTQEQQPEKRPEYIITQDEWNSLYSMDQNDFVIDLLERVRSRGSVEHDAQVAAKEREKVIKMIDDIIPKLNHSLEASGINYLRSKLEEEQPK